MGEWAECGNDKCARTSEGLMQRRSSSADRPLPGWPAAMVAEMAATYVGLSGRMVRNLVGRGRFPPPIRLSDGRRGWRRTDLDAWVRGGGIGGWDRAAATTLANEWDVCTQP